jgi:hypothetical protein
MAYNQFAVESLPPGGHTLQAAIQRRGTSGWHILSEPVAIVVKSLQESYARRDARVDTIHKETQQETQQEAQQGNATGDATRDARGDARGVTPGDARRDSRDDVLGATTGDTKESHGSGGMHASHDSNNVLECFSSIDPAVGGYVAVLNLRRRPDR